MSKTESSCSKLIEDRRVAARVITFKVAFHLGVQIVFVGEALAQDSGSKFVVRNVLGDGRKNTTTWKRQLFIEISRKILRNVKDNLNYVYLKGLKQRGLSVREIYYYFTHFSIKKQRNCLLLINTQT